MLSDMVGGGVLHSRHMRTGGASDKSARTANPVKDVTPSLRPSVPTARIQATIRADFT